MLVRTLRLTDKISNALLRISIWLGAALAGQMYRLRLALVGTIEAIYLAVMHVGGRGQFASNEERRRAMMARRAAEAAARPAIREDPLKTQNRALSMFTVVLMGSLMLLVLWFTGLGQNTGTPQKLAGAALPKLETQAPPTGFPTIVPTATSIPDPLRAGGSLVYTLRDRGHDNLWALGIGQSAPIRLTNTTSDDRDPVWSPDGSKIAFASHRDNNWELYVMEAATGATTRLTFDLAFEGAPTWSPDGKFIAYEGYQDNVLDIYIIAADGHSNPLHVPSKGTPNFSPAWSPDGRRIAYASLRDGNQEIYITNLDKPAQEQRFTSTTDIDENYPSWSPDGKTLAYSARTNGLDLVYAKPIAQPDAAPLVVGQGLQPSWAPNGASLIFALDNGQTTTLVGGQFGSYGVSALAIATGGLARHPNWSSVVLPRSLIQSGGVSAAALPALYKEDIHYKQDTPPFNKVAALNGVTAPSPYLADTVDDSFVALRASVVQQVGFDFLGTLAEALWSTDRLPEPGQSRLSWHYAGRAFDFDRNLVFGDPPPVEVVREDAGVNTFWRVYIRLPKELQGGQLGEPLKEIPWDFASRRSGDPQAYEEGGRPKAAIPAGYYVDFTQLAEDYGWMPVPAERTWRSNYPGILYWEFDKRENLSWTDAMLQLYTQSQVDAFLSGPTSIPTPIAPPTELPTATEHKTPTPIPPDQKK